MSDFTQAERLADELRPTIPCDVLKLWADDAAAELRRLAESERALLEVLELAAEYVDDYCATRTKALGHLPPCDERARVVVHALIAATKEARNAN